MAQNSNRIPHTRRFVTCELGENYWFGGCGRYVMEALGESQFDYECFVGPTGDVFAQAYAGGRFLGDGVTDYRMHSPQGGAYIEGIFEKCGYAATFIFQQLQADPKGSLQKLMSHIDRGVPVISNMYLGRFIQWAVFVGYDKQGEELLYMSNNMTAPGRISAANVFAPRTPSHPIMREPMHGWLFVGEKTADISLEKVYRDTIYALPALLREKTDTYCFGASAFRTWAADIAGGKFALMESSAFDSWFMHGTYVCNAATNACCAPCFLQRAMELCPDMGFLGQVSDLYRRMEVLWHGEGDSLEALGGSFNVTLENLQKRDQQEKIAANLEEFAAAADTVADVLEKGLQSL